MRGLRVLDLSSTSISTLPASVGKMILLKVLNLRETEIRAVAACVRHLRSLLFLALPKWRCNYLPVWISELKCLQHLECEAIYRLPKGISKLASLRTLRTGWLHLSIEEDEFMRLEDLANMTQHQELRLAINRGMELKRMEEGILEQMVKMRRLKLDNCLGIYFPHIQESMTAMKHLESLTLQRFAVPSWICEFANLRELGLIECGCSDYPELQRMPNLVRLELRANWRCREFPNAFGKSGGFLHLHFFTIILFTELEEFPKLEEGAMACLEEFNIINCKKVKKVERLEWLKTLKVFEYYYSATNECRETLKKGREYWNKIKAINLEVIIRG